MGLIVMCTFILANMQIGTIHGFHEKVTKHLARWPPLLFCCDVRLQEWNRATTGVWLMLIAVGLSLGLVFAGYRFALKFEPRNIPLTLMAALTLPQLCLAFPRALSRLSRL